MMEMGSPRLPDAPAPLANGAVLVPMIPIIYHPKYNITVFGLERLHPFDGLKYRRIRDALIARGLRGPAEFVTPPRIRRVDLERVHPREYLRSLRRPKVLAEILSVPVLARIPSAFTDWRVLSPMRWATSGTILAARLALDHGLAINLSGGYHHASAGAGEGFCVYADIPIAAAALHAEGRVDRVLVVDLDAHQGNGTAATIRPWPWAAIFDVFEEDLYPVPKQAEDFPIPIPAGTTGPEYLAIDRAGSGPP